MWRVVVAVVDSSIVDIATDAGTRIKDTALAVIQVLVPLAVGWMLATRAVPLFKSILGAYRDGLGAFYYDEEDGKHRCSSCGISLSASSGLRSQGGSGHRAGCEYA